MASHPIHVSGDPLTPIQTQSLPPNLHYSPPNPLKTKALQLKPRSTRHPKNKLDKRTNFIPSLCPPRPPYLPLHESPSGHVTSLEGKLTLLAPKTLEPMATDKVTPTTTAEAIQAQSLAARYRCEFVD